MKCCPHCAQKLDPSAFGMELFATKFSLSKAAIVRALIRVQGGPVHNSVLIGVSGIGTQGTLRVQIHEINNMIQCTDYWIENVHNYGYRLRVRINTRRNPKSRNWSWDDVQYPDYSPWILDEVIEEDNEHASTQRRIHGGGTLDDPQRQSSTDSGTRLPGMVRGGLSDAVQSSRGSRRGSPFG